MTTTPIETGGRNVNPAIAEMAAINRWVCAKFVTNKSGKLTKPPFCVGGQRHASSTDPATWGTFDACWASAFANGEARGIGFVFNGADDLIGIDIDKCITGDGTIAPWALEIVRKVGSYTERSVSELGLHIICRGIMEGEGRKVGHIEIYPRNRYFWMTGAHLAGTPDSINAVTPDVLAGLLAQANRKAKTFDDLPADLQARFLDACAWDTALADRWNGEPPQGDDQSRSAWDMALARLLRRYGGFTLEDFAALAAVWAYGTGSDGDARQRRRAWDKADDDAQEQTSQTARDGWPEPDLSVLSDHRLSAPTLPLEVFGEYWSGWISAQAESKSCASDYVAAGLIAGAGAVIGNAKWGSPWAGWVEPPVLWFAAIGNPSSGKSPGLDAPRDVLTQIEIDANAGRREELQTWDTAARAAKLHLEVWEGEVKVAIKKDASPPPRPDAATAPERPTRRRIITNDATVEKIARIVVENPKGMLLFRDELAGWIGSLDRYGGSGSDRAFYLESYGGRPYAVDRVKDPEPIVVPALTITVLGGIQPDRLSTMVLCGDDDGLAARIVYVWPERVPPSRPTRCPPSGAKTKLSMLYGLEDRCAETGERAVLMFSPAATEALQAYREQVAEAETAASGLFLSWLGKLPGMVVRLSNVLEHLYWCGDREMGMPPTVITERAAVAAIAFLDGYAVPMARRCFGEAALPQVDRDAISIARWLMSQSPMPEIVNARDLRRQSVLSAREADRYDPALTELAEAGWLRPAPARAGGSSGRKRKDWTVNPGLRRQA